MERAKDFGQSTDSAMYKVLQSIGLLPNPEMRAYQVSLFLLITAFLIPLFPSFLYLICGLIINTIVVNITYFIPMPHPRYRPVLYQC